MPLLRTAPAGIHPLMRIPVPWVFLVTYLVGVVLTLWLPLPTGAAEVHRIVRAIGLAQFALGGGIAVVSLAQFRIAKTTTVPFHQATRLVTWGPYRFSRNPMYLSLTLLYLGEAAFLVQPWPALLLPLAFVYADRVVIPYEERRLQETFGADYAAYSARVRRWL